MKRSLFPFALVPLLAGSLCAQAVYVVDDDGGPGVDFDDLQAAINVAAAGDTLLVRSGFYEGPVVDEFSLVGKPLRVLADVGAEVVVRDVLRVSDVNSGSVTLRGIVFEDVSLGSSASIVAVDCAAPIWIEDCHVDAHTAVPFFLEVSGMRTSGCDQVIAVRSSFAGNPTSLGSAGFGIWAIDSSLHLFDCVATGGNANSDGAAGARLQGSTLFASGSTFQGGAGLDGNEIFGCGAGDGGAGVELTNADSEANLLDCTALGGPKGVETSCSVAVDGQAFANFGGTVTVLPGAARHYASDSLAFSGSSALHSWEGEPGDLAVLALGAAPGAVTLGNVTGTLLLGGSVSIVGLGVLPTGELDLNLAVPALGALAFFPIYLQGAFLSGPDAFLGPGSAQVLLP